MAAVFSSLVIIYEFDNERIRGCCDCRILDFERLGINSNTRAHSAGNGYSLHVDTLCT
jgi:hypothetical protein